MARTKTVDIEGHQYKLASLTMDQAEEFWDDPDVSVKGMRNRSWQNVLYSLNNAGMGITREEIAKQITIDGFNKLYNEMLEVSYLKVPEGETKAAAATQTSSSSEAA